MKKTKKKPIFYDETNIGGACMTGKLMTKKQEKELGEWVANRKAKAAIKRSKRN